MFNLEIISYTISDQQNGKTILKVLKNLFTPCPYQRTFHSDRSWGYQMKNYQAMLVESHIYQSISRKENCYDNDPIENFFSILKREFYDSFVYRSRKKLKKAIEEFTRYYNEDLIKEKLGGLSSKQYREQMKAA